MAVLYIKEQGAIVKKLGERIIVSKGSQTLLDVPIIKIENISIIGNVQVTMQALRTLFENGIDVSFFTYSGKFLGHAGAESSKNIFLRFEQYGAYMDDNRRLEMAKAIVNNKILNQMTLIRDYRWKNKEYDWKNSVEKMEKIRKTIDEKHSISELLGVEGMCSNIYFNAFGHMILGDFEFKTRNRRPPKDPVNIILSLAYTFLTREMCNALDSESFETYLGFLHGIRYGRKSLALDMIEEFRQPVVDRLTILLFNKRMLGVYDFDTDEDGQITLNEEGFKKFCREYERWITGRNSLAGENFRKKMQEQVAALKKNICNSENYSPYCWKKENVLD